MVDFTKVIKIAKMGDAVEAAKAARAARTAETVKSAETITNAEKVNEVLNSYEFKDWFGKSKVVDTKDNPLIVYHGQGAKFNTFESDTGAIYFTPDKETAKGYAEQNGIFDEPITAYLSIKNPYIAKGGESSYLTKEKVEKLKSLGYDGVKGIIDGGDSVEWVVFRSEQIKSAINNRTFDPNNPDISK